jgi:hypothetical protein
MAEISGWLEVVKYSTDLGFPLLDFPRVVVIGRARITIQFGHCSWL